MKDIISNCFLCEEKSLHVAGTEEAQVMQCINCGYVTSTKYIGTKETNEEFLERLRAAAHHVKDVAPRQMRRFSGNPYFA